MRLTHVYIAKFRAIREAEIRVGTELAIVGKNNSGKSTILRAVNSFFNFESERQAFEEGRHQFQKTTTAIVELRFDKVPTSSSLTRHGAGTDQFRARLRYKKKPVWEVHDGTAWSAAPASMHVDLTKLIRFAYIPARRDHEVAGWGEGGLLRRAVERYVALHIEKRDNITPKVSGAVSQIKKGAFRVLQKKIKQKFPIDRGFSFEIDYAQTPDYTFLLSNMVLRITEGVTTVDLQDCGSGTQSLAAFALYSYLAELDGATYILGVEEPEQNLHPQAQREMLQALRSSPLQVLFTTHSTVVLDELKHHEVVLCRRVSSTTRTIEAKTTQLSVDFWTRHSLDEDRYYQFHRYHNSDFFFSSYVILSESKTDAEVLKAVLAGAGVDLIREAVTILNIDGVNSLPHAFHLLKELQIPFATVLDKDYFIPYQNDNLSSSRTPSGFPKYGLEYKTGTLLQEMVPDAAEQTDLLDKLIKNHSRAMDILEKSAVFCFRWSIDIDLVNSSAARSLFFSTISVPTAEQTTTGLLVQRKNKIKKLEVLLPVVQGLAIKNLPNSYKRLRKALPKLIRESATS